MNTLETFASAWTGIMGVLAEAASCSLKELYALGLDSKTAKQLDRYAQIYFRAKSAPHKQETARAAAEAAGHTLATLGDIERLVGRVPAKHHWDMRIELCQVWPNTRALEDRAAELQQEYGAAPQAEPKQRVSHRAVPDSDLTDLTLRAPSHLVKAALDSAEGVENMHAAEAILRAATSSEGLDGPEITPALIIPVGDSVESWRRISGGEVELSLTNGTVLNGKDVARQHLSRLGLVLLIDEYSGEPVELYRFRDVDGARDARDPKRHLNRKESQIQALLTPVCAGIGCNIGADDCQNHHIEAHKHGGPTTLGNSTKLCGFHNGRNDDDRNKPKYGHIEKIDGLDYWVPAFGGRPRLNQHRAAKGGALRAVRAMKKAMGKAMQKA
ncbi:HNH endonuclease signature motif containing protein [Corynebacterium cystitidis]|nr:HNH endonuclease signature motif containing protein [Corynebacterium cystitidis]